MRNVLYNICKGYLKCKGKYILSTYIKMWIRRSIRRSLISILTAGWGNWFSCSVLLEVLKRWSPSINSNYISLSFISIFHIIWLQVMKDFNLKLRPTEFVDIKRKWRNLIGSFLHDTTNRFFIRLLDNKLSCLISWCDDLLRCCAVCSGIYWIRLNLILPVMTSDISYCELSLYLRMNDRFRPSLGITILRLK